MVNHSLTLDTVAEFTQYVAWTIPKLGLVWCQSVNEFYLA